MLKDLSDFSDEVLVAKVKEGEYQYFTPLFRRHQLRVMRLLSRYLDDHLDVEDVTQDVFIKVFHAIHDFRGESLFYTWLYRIVVNTANNFLNSKNRLDRLRVDPIVFGEDEQHFIGEDMPHFDTPENILSTRLLLKRLEEVMARLSQDMRQALILREYQGLSYEDIAKKMNCPIGTVRSRIFRGREVLADEIRKTAGIKVSIGHSD